MEFSSWDTLLQKINVARIFTSLCALKCTWDCNNGVKMEGGTILSSVSQYSLADSVLVKLEKTPEFGLPVTTKPNKQRQGLNPYGRFIQMAGELRRWQVHTLTDHLVFSFQAKVFIAGNKHGWWGVLKFREKLIGLEKNNFSILVLGSGL